MKRSIFRDFGTHCSRWQTHSGVGYSQRRCELQGGREEEEEEGGGGGGGGDVDW